VIIYNVTIKVAPEIDDMWVKWMKEEHMNDLVNTGLFTDSRLCRLLEQDDSEGRTYTAQYFCQTMEDYNTYIDQYAPIMREKGIKRFGDKFIAFRTVMEIVG
jgi:predicted GIY-YIG superfamily endonuclease